MGALRFRALNYRVLLLKDCYFLKKIRHKSGYPCCLFCDQVERQIPLFLLHYLLSYVQLVSVVNGMQTILVINSKGGSGKTTLTTNLASYFVNKGHKTTILDYDPQGSSLQWLKVRPSHQAAIHGANAAPSKKANQLRSIAMAVPADTEYLIVDAPAGAEGMLLQEMVRKSDFIVIPVAPSAIDIHATADFIKQLLLVGGIRHRNIKTAIVANRVRNTMPVYEPLERFLKTLKLPFLTKLSDSDNYIYAAEQGLGICEMDEYNTDKERDELKPVTDWLSNEVQEPVMPEVNKKNVVFIDTMRLSHR